MHQMSYGRFAAMVSVSTLVMYGLMYLNCFEIDHIFFSQTRAWMALIMGSVMAALMLSFMWNMYASRNANIGILVGSGAIFVIALSLLRTQVTVSDVDYMKAMIPHHSIAILTSMRAHIQDKRVRKIADGILRAQIEEIMEMKGLISDLERNPPAQDAPDLPPISHRPAP
jgi:hypothetical protein